MSSPNKKRKGEQVSVAAANEANKRRRTTHDAIAGGDRADDKDTPSSMEKEGKVRLFGLPISPPFWLLPEEP